MTHLDTDDPLEHILADALRKHAAGAPRMPDEWSTDPAMRLSSRAPTRWRVPVIVGVVSAAVLVIGLVFTARPDDESPVAEPPPWTPPGTEFPSEDLGAATEVFDGPVVADLTRQIGIEGHPPQIVSRSLTYFGNETAVEQVCTSELGSAGCRPDSNGAAWSTSVTSSVDNRVADYDLWTVEGLPTEVAFVAYQDGDLQLWQRPISSFAAFPNVEGSNEIVVGFDALGNEVGRYGTGEAIDAQSATVAAPVADISRPEFEDLGVRTKAEARRCLMERGGTLVDDIATFDAGIDPRGVWRACVAEVKTIVGDAVADLEPTFYDPTTERPMNTDPAFEYFTD